MFVVVAIDCCAVAELELEFASSFGRWDPAALAGFSFSSMFVAVGLHLSVMVDVGWVQTLPVGG